jgi:hypothetical protein
MRRWHQRGRNGVVACGHYIVHGCSTRYGLDGRAAHAAAPRHSLPHRMQRRRHRAAWSVRINARRHGQRPALIFRVGVVSDIAPVNSGRGAKLIEREPVAGRAYIVRHRPPGRRNVRPFILPSNGCLAAFHQPAKSRSARSAPGRVKARRRNIHWQGSATPLREILRSSRASALRQRDPKEAKPFVLSLPIAKIEQSEFSHRAPERVAVVARSNAIGQETIDQVSSLSTSPVTRTNLSFVCRRV